MEIKDSDYVKLTVAELLQIVRVCVIKDRVENPEQIDYDDYVKSFLAWPSEIENKEMA